MRTLATLVCITLLSHATAFGQKLHKSSPTALTIPSGFAPLFDGKTLSGWDNYGGGIWTMTSNGVLRGEGKPSYLCSPNTYTNFIMRATVNVSDDANSGIFFRAQPSSQGVTAVVGRGNIGVAVGYEAQIGNSDPQKTGSLYNFVVVKDRLVQDNAWFGMIVAVVGNRIVIQVNGKTTVDYIDKKSTFTSGHIAIQKHHAGNAIMFRDVCIRSLPIDEQAAMLALRSELRGIK